MVSGLSTTRGEQSKDSPATVAVVPVPMVTLGTLCLARFGWLVTGAVSSAVVTILAALEVM